MRRVAFILLLGGCASGHGRSELPSLPPLPPGPLVTAGARCQGAKCRCRPVDDYGRPSGDKNTEEAIADGQNRFEFRTGRGFDMQSVTIDGRGTLVKDTSQTDPSCASVD